MARGSCSPTRNTPTTSAISSLLSRCRTRSRNSTPYNPKKAKALLAEAGYPNGFSFKVQVCSCSPDHMDLLPLVAAYLEQVGVKIEIQPMEYGAFLSAMTTKTNAAGYFMLNGHTNPTTTLRKSFVTKQTCGIRRSSPIPTSIQQDERGLSRSRTKAKRRGNAQGDDARRSSTRRPTSSCPSPTSIPPGGRG